MHLTHDSQLKLKRFCAQYENKAVWQVNALIGNLVETLVKEELNKKIDAITQVVSNFREE